MFLSIRDGRDSKLICLNDGRDLDTRLVLLNYCIGYSGYLLCSKAAVPRTLTSPNDLFDRSATQRYLPEIGSGRNMLVLLHCNCRVHSLNIQQVLRQPRFIPLSSEEVNLPAGHLRLQAKFCVTEPAPNGKLTEPQPVTQLTYLTLPTVELARAACT